MNRYLTPALCALLALSACNAPVQKSREQQILEGMSLRQKVAQLFISDAAVPDIDSLVAREGIGGVIFFSCPADTLRARVERLQAEASIPLLTTIDGETGLSMRIPGLEKIPYANKIASDSLAFEYGCLAGRQLREFGIDVNFAPVVDVNTNPKNPIIGRRSFGSDPELVASRGAAFSEGIQHEGVISCAKHFPGHGDTSTDSHKTLPVLRHSRERLDSVELLPFRRMIEAGVDMIMTGHLSVPALDSTGTPASISKPIVTGLLREKMGFEGLIVTDGLNMTGVTMLFPTPEKPAVEAFRAGNDLLLLAVDPIGAIDEICRLIESGEESEEDLNNRVLKVLKLKIKLYDSRLL